MTDAVIEARSVAKHYGAVSALAGLDLRIPRGGVFGLLGPNGAGKSTLLRIALDLVRPSAGEILLFGAPVDAKTLRRVGGFIEAPRFHPYLNAMQTLHSVALTAGIGAPDAEALLERVGLAEAAHRRVDGFSLGMKQLQPNVAEDFFRSHGVGDILAGRVVRTTEFGAFVELYEGIEGLVHVSELSKDRVDKPEDAVQVDQQVRVKIIKMDAVEKKIGLSIKAALDEPEEASLSDYADRQQGHGSATLGDLVDREVFQRGGEGEGGEAGGDEDR